MKKTNIILIFSLLTVFLLQSCKKVDENPELSDPIYIDIKTELDLSTKQEAETQTQLNNDIKAFKEVVPQSGMHNMMRNKMSTTENLLNIVQQQKKFFEIKLEQRKNEVRSRYRESLKKDGRPWPDAKEIADYKIRMKLQHDKFAWDTKNVPRGTENKNQDPKEKKKTGTKAASSHGETSAGSEQNKPSGH